MLKTPTMPCWRCWQHSVENLNHGLLYCIMHTPCCSPYSLLHRLQRTRTNKNYKIGNNTTHKIVSTVLILMYKYFVIALPISLYKRGASAAQVPQIFPSPAPYLASMTSSSRSSPSWSAITIYHLVLTNRYGKWKRWGLPLNKFPSFL